MTHKIKLPDEIELRARRAVDGTVTFTYVERDRDVDALRRSADLLRTADGGLTVAISDDGHEVAVGGTVPRRDFGDRMASEFLMWSSLADVTVGELMSILVLKAAQPAPAAVAASLEAHAASVTRVQLREVIAELESCVARGLTDADARAAIERLLARGNRILTDAAAGAPRQPTPRAAAVAAGAPTRAWPCPACDCAEPCPDAIMDACAVFRDWCQRGGPAPTSAPDAAADPAVLK